MIVFIRNQQTNEILIGYTSEPKKRLAALQKDSAARLELLGAIYGDHEDKMSYHRQFGRSHVKGDLFKGDILGQVRGIIAMNPTKGPPATNVIVAGDRDFTDRGLVFRALTELHRKHPIGCVNFVGGWDFERWAREWGKQNNVFERPFYPQSRHGQGGRTEAIRRMLRAQIDAKVFLVFLSQTVTPTTKALIRKAMQLGIEAVEKGGPVLQPQG